jgi:hypothetical protein
MPAGLLAQYTAFTNENGRGYGVVTTTSGAVLSPIPDPSRVGQVWVARPGAPALAGRVFCNGATWCAGFTATGQVQVLENAAAPTLGLVPQAVVVGQARTLDADAGDPDGDPVFVTWSSPNLLLVPVGASGGVASATAQASACTLASVPLTVTAWDGKTEHVTSQTLQVPVIAGGLVVSPATASATANGAPVTLTASLDSGCAPTVVNWSNDAGPVTSIQWVPPRNVCTASGSTSQVTVTANNQVATASVLVQGWGPPDAPVFPSPAQQVAGTAVVWSPTTTHVCQAATGFPGVLLGWTLDAGLTGATLAPVDGGVLVVAPFSCTPFSVSATARSTVVGDTGTSAPGVLQVNVSPGFAPLSASTPVTLQVTSLPGDATAQGTFSVTATCAPQRALGATVWLLGADGGVNASGTFVGTNWSLGVPPSCAQTWTARLEVAEDGGLTGAVAQVPVLGPSSALPITAATPFTMNLGVDGGLASGRFDVTAGCVDQRRFTATVDVALPDGGALATGSYAAPGPWSLVVPPTCAPSLVATARLYEDGGLTPALEQVSFAGPSSAQPITAATPFSMNLIVDGGLASGRLTLQTTCVSERVLGANIDVTHLDGGAVTHGTFALGDWALPLPATCDPRLVATATLLEDGGVTPATEQATLTGPSSATPITGATPFSMNLAWDAVAARASGVLAVQTDCVAERSLSAIVSVLQADGGVVASRPFVVPGPWSLDVPGGCSGGTFSVRAQLLEAGTPAGPVDTQSLPAQVLPVVPGDLDATGLEVACGSGGRLLLTLAAQPGTCAGGALTWSQLGGPRASVVSQAGRSLELQTEALDYTLIGQALTFSILVDAGGGNQATVERAVTLTGPRFVQASAQLSPLLPTTEEPVDARVVLTNTSACRVDAVDLSVTGAGLLPAADTVTVEGSRFNASVQNDVLTVPGLSLENGASVVVRFRARPLLSGTLRLEPSVSVRGVPVTLSSGRVAPTGCGCTQPPGTALLALGALLLLGRRRVLVSMR